MKIREILFNSIRRSNGRCPNCNQEFLYEQSFDVAKALREIAQEIYKELEKMKQENMVFSIRLDGYNEALSEAQEVIKKMCEVGE